MLDRQTRIRLDAYEHEKFKELNLSVLEAHKVGDGLKEGLPMLVDGPTIEKVQHAANCPKVESIVKQKTVVSSKEIDAESGPAKSVKEANQAKLEE